PVRRTRRREACRPYSDAAGRPSRRGRLRPRASGGCVMSGWFGIALTFALLALNALFVAAEFALVSARRDRLDPKVAGGSRSARVAVRAMERVSLAMAGAQLGITICTLGLGAISEPAIAHLLEPGFDVLSVPDGLVHPISFVIATGLVA